MEDIETRLDSAIKKVVKEELERIMGIERDVFLEQSNGTRNGHYGRDLTTRYGHIDNLKVPRDREGTFRTHIFQPYQRYTGIEDFIGAIDSLPSSTQWLISSMTALLPCSASMTILVSKTTIRTASFFSGLILFAIG